MGQRYVPVSLAEFRDALDKTGLRWQEGRQGNERIFSAKHPKSEYVEVIVYSTISCDDFVSRDCGDDAIRIISLCIHPSLPSPVVLTKHPRTYRVPGWDNKIVSKVQDAINQTPVVRLCTKCTGGVMVKRSGRNGEFYGCSNFGKGKCKATLKVEWVEGEEVKTEEKVGGNEPKPVSKYRVEVENFNTGETFWIVDTDKNFAVAEVYDRDIANKICEGLNNDHG